MFFPQRLTTSQKTFYFFKVLTSSIVAAAIFSVIFQRNPYNMATNPTLHQAFSVQKLVNVAKISAVAGIFSVAFAIARKGF